MKEFVDDNQSWAVAWNERQTHPAIDASFMICDCTGYDGWSIGHYDKQDDATIVYIEVKACSFIKAGHNSPCLAVITLSCNCKFPNAFSVQQIYIYCIPAPQTTMSITAVNLTDGMRIRVDQANQKGSVNDVIAL